MTKKADFPFSYSVEPNPRRKRIAVTVTADGRVIVKTPARVSARAVQQMLRESTPWILSALSRASRRAEAAGVEENFQCAPGETLPLFGWECPIKAADTPYFQGGTFYLSGETKEARMKEAALLYTRIAEQVLPKMVARLASQVGVQPAGVKIGKAARSWGYCKKDGTLHFTWRLICHHEAFVEYVVVHELCHLLYFDHSPAFWSAVERVCPEHKKIEQSGEVKKMNLRLAVQGFMPQS